MGTKLFEALEAEAVRDFLKPQVGEKNVKSRGSGVRWVVCPPFAVLCLLSIFVPCLCRILLGCFWGLSLPKFSSYPVSFFSTLFLFVLLSFIFPYFSYLLFSFLCVVLFASFVSLLYVVNSVTMDSKLLCFSF